MFSSNNKQLQIYFNLLKKLYKSQLRYLDPVSSIQLIEAKWPINKFELIESLGDFYLNDQKHLQASNVYIYLKNFRDPSLNLLFKIAKAYYLSGNFKESLTFAKKSYDLSTTNLQISKLYLDCLLSLGEAKEIEKLTQFLIEIYPNDNDFKFLLAHAKRLNGNFVSAIEILKELETESKDYRYTLSLADTIGETDSKSAIETYEILISEGLELPLLNKYNLSIHYLRVKEFKKGWEYFEYGLDKSIGARGRLLPYNLKDTHRIFNINTHLNYSKVLVCCEQGIGDQLLFFSALTEALVFFPNLFVICEKRIFTILERSFPKVNFSYTGIFNEFEINNLSSKEMVGYIPLGSLFSIIKPTYDSIKVKNNPFIVHNQSLSSEFSSFLFNLSKGKKIIGICWKSNSSENTKFIKNIDFTDWLPLFNEDSIIVNLQYGDTSSEQQMVHSLGLEMISFNQFDFTKDLDHWLSLANACEGIISISSSIVHFAGSIGKKVAVVMPHAQGHWSLGIDDEQSIFYSNVYIYRSQDYLNHSSLLLDAASLFND